ncbi:MAG: 30S ribosomal protein S11 [Patescibacteria group bacterium]
MEDNTPQTTTEAPAKSSPKKKKSKRPVPHGQAHIYATFNNTIVTITDLHGGKLASSSAGACGFRGSKKGTAYAAQIAAEKVAEMAKSQHAMVKVDIFVKGVGQGRDTAMRALIAQDLVVESITDKTGIPFGGPRPRKARRG